MKGLVIDVYSINGAEVEIMPFTVCRVLTQNGDCPLPSTDAAWPTELLQHFVFCSWISVFDGKAVCLQILADQLQDCLGLESTLEESAHSRQQVWTALHVLPNVFSHWSVPLLWAPAVSFGTVYLETQNKSFVANLNASKMGRSKNPLKEIFCFLKW